MMKSSPNLPRIITSRSAYMLIVGNIIGIGIFTTTGYIARYTPTPGVLLLLWFLGGILSFCGALTYAELASLFPRAGGDYHYLSRAYHPLLGYLFGWSTFAVTYTGSIATIAVGFSHYFTNLLPDSLRLFSLNLPIGHLQIRILKIVAIFIVVLITFLNVRGIRLGSRIQTLFTILGIGVLLVFIAMGLTSPLIEWKQLTPLFPKDISFSLFSGLGVALIGVYFTYSGWTAIAYIAGEVHQPEKSIPTAMWQGVLTVTILYLLINTVYLLALPIGKIQNMVDIGYRALLILQGEQWSVFFSVMIVIAVLSTLNATILSGARIYFAMAQENRFFPFSGKLHSRYRSPANALWLQAAWAILLILSGSFNQLLTYTVFIMVCFAFLSGISLFILRKKEAPAIPIYRVWGYPIVPIIYIAVTGWIMVNTLIKHPLESFGGIGIILLGLPLYFYYSRRSKAGNNTP